MGSVTHSYRPRTAPLCVPGRAPVNRHGPNEASDQPFRRGRRKEEASCHQVPDGNVTAARNEKQAIKNRGGPRSAASRDFGRKCDDGGQSSEKE